MHFSKIQRGKVEASNALPLCNQILIMTSSLSWLYALNFETEAQAKDDVRKLGAFFGVIVLAIVIFLQ